MWRGVGRSGGGDEPAFAESMAAEFDYPMEIDLELEISEDELANLDNLAGGTEQLEEPFKGMDDEVSVGEAAGAASHDDDALPTEGLLAGEHFVEFAEDALADLAGFSEDEADGLFESQENSGPEGLFTGFKKGLDQQLDQGDTETRYNLGIAFKEMGLYDEAITEFEAAAADPQRRTDCLTLQGICCRDKGDFAEAERYFGKGLEQDHLSEEEFLSVTYELALLHEGAGRTEDALAAYRSIEARRPDFRETRVNMARLQGGSVTEEIDLVELEHEDLA